MTDSIRRLHPLLRGLTNVFAVGYFAGCLLLLGWAFSVSSGDRPDASLAGVWPVLATLPVRVIVLVAVHLLDVGQVAIVLGVCVGALANAIVIGATVEALRGDSGRAGPAA
ncbi:SCO4225 family membrane protein [Streptomyces sp. NPDC127108]|uniref:SCO4225 family membrane protein n=1 Tax=Streptomyces sp. NPDC127108 TaxID=3345361 RepID=UPI00363C2D11